MEEYKAGDFNIQLKSDSTPLINADRAAHDKIQSQLNRTYIPTLSEEGRIIHYEERRNWDYFWLVDPLDGTKEFIRFNGEFTINIALIERRRPVIGVVLLPVSSTLYFAVRGKGAFKVEQFELTGPREQCQFERLIERAQRLPLPQTERKFTVVISRSSHAPEIADYLAPLHADHPDLKIIKMGSSLKNCRVAEGLVDLYPRISETNEWDTAAGQAILEMAGMELVEMSSLEPLLYNKETLVNPPFVARRKGFVVPKL